MKHPWVALLIPVGIGLVVDFGQYTEGTQAIGRAVGYLLIAWGIALGLLKSEWGPLVRMRKHLKLVRVRWPIYLHRDVPAEPAKPAGPPPPPRVLSIAVRLVDMTFSPKLKGPAPILFFTCYAVNGLQEPIRLFWATGRVAIGGEEFHEKIELRTLDDRDIDTGGLQVPPYGHFRFALKLRLSLAAAAHVIETMEQAAESFEIKFNNAEITSFRGTAASAHPSFKPEEFELAIPERVNFFIKDGRPRVAYLAQIPNMVS